VVGYTKFLLSVEGSLDYFNALVFGGGREITERCSLLKVSKPAGGQSRSRTQPFLFLV
jgi:hypothetical protein